MSAGHVIGRAVELNANFGRKYNRVQDVVVVAVDLDRSRVRDRPMLLVSVVCAQESTSRLIS